MKKLTLSADKDVIALARKLAEREGVSISALFAGFVRARAQKLSFSRAKLGPLTRKALALSRRSDSSDKSDREALEEALTEKYGIDS